VFFSCILSLGKTIIYELGGEYSYQIFDIPQLKVLPYLFCLPKLLQEYCNILLGKYVCIYFLFVVFGCFALVLWQAKLNSYQQVGARIIQNYSFWL